jgi:hypothetical protein
MTLTARLLRSARKKACLFLGARVDRGDGFGHLPPLSPLDLSLYQNPKFRNFPKFVSHPSLITLFFASQRPLCAFSRAIRYGRAGVSQTRLRGDLNANVKVKGAQ